MEKKEARFKLGDEGLIQNLVIAAALVAVPGVLLAIYYKALFAGLVNDGAQDFAQLGRNISQGRGFVTYFLRPLALTHGANPLRQPDLSHGPLYPFIIALFFGALKATDSIAAAVSGLFYIATVPLVFLLGQRVFNRNVGLISALVFAINSLMLEYALSGLPVTFYAFITTLLLLVLHGIFSSQLTSGQEERPQPRLLIGLAGLLTAGMYLTDPLFIWVAPVVFIALFTTPGLHRTKTAIGFLVPFLIGVLPWMMRNASQGGNPVFGMRGIEIFMDTKNFYPGNSLYRMLPDDLIPSTGLFKAFVGKLLLGSGLVINTFPQVSASWMLAFLLPSLLFRFANPAINLLRRTMLWCFLAILFGSLIFGIQMPIFVTLIPMMLVFSIAYLLYLAQEAKLNRSGVATLVGLLGVAVVLPVMRDIALTDRPQLSPDVETAQVLRKAIARDEISLSDRPWMLAWYADRPSIWIPAVDGKIKVVREKFPQLRWLILTQESRTLSTDWARVYDGMLQWNMNCRQQDLAQSSLPEEQRRYAQPITFSPKMIPLGVPVPPILEGLDGFTTVAPRADMSVTTGIAMLPGTPRQK